MPDRHGTGTNGLLLTPPNAIAPSFGPDSRARHERLARDAGADCRIERPASLLLDIDTGEDLAVLRARLTGEPVRAPRTRAVLGLVETLADLTARSLSGLPEVVLGADLAELIVRSLDFERPARPLRDGQIVAIAHKVVSKAEGAIVDLRTVEPSARARWPRARGTLARAARKRAEPQRSGTDRRPPKDPRAVQVVLDQSAEIVRAERGVMICRTHHGFVCANAGVDASNSADGDTLIVLPRDPDASARRIRARLRELTGASVGVLITDSFGRAWRHGQCDVAIGCAGMRAAGRLAWAHRQRRPRAARHLAGGRRRDRRLADLARAKDSREPVVIVEGLERFVTAEDGPGRRAAAPLEEDLFR